MAFVKEYPVSQALLDRFDWTALPLLYQGEAGEYCKVPIQAFVDYKQDLVYYTGGGGVGRTTRINQPNTEVLYYQGSPIRFVYSYTDSKKYKNEITGLFVFDWEEWSVIKIVAFSKLKFEERNFLKAIEEAAHAKAIDMGSSAPKSLTVKISTKVEYI